MREFLRGWRRKVGFLTLLLALASLGLWGRSLMAYDRVDFPTFSLVSRTGWFTWYSPQWKVDDLIEWETDVITTDINFYLPGDPDIDWDFQVPGFGLGWTPNHGHGRAYLRIISLWYGIAPLTLLSAYLILGPPQKRARPPERLESSR